MPELRSASLTTHRSPVQLVLFNTLTISTVFHLGYCIPCGLRFRLARSTNLAQPLDPIRTPVKTLLGIPLCSGSLLSSEVRLFTTGTSRVRETRLMFRPPNLLILASLVLNRGGLSPVADAVLGYILTVCDINPTIRSSIGLDIQRERGARLPNLPILGDRFDAKRRYA
jgi:hypothetical protein